MKAPAHIKTAAQYLAHLPAERRAPLTTLHRAIRKAAPRLKPVIVFGMIGYGPFHYVYESGREGDSATVCLASQKNNLTLYVMGVENGTYIAEKNKARLGKVSVGKCCIRFKKLEDLNLPVALELVKKAEKLMAQGKYRP